MLSGIEIFNFFVSDHLNVSEGKTTLFLCKNKSACLQDDRTYTLKTLRDDYNSIPWHFNYAR